MWKCGRAQAKRFEKSAKKERRRQRKPRASEPERQQAAYLRNGGHRRVAAFGMLGDVAKVAAKQGATRVAHHAGVIVLVIPLWK